MVVSNKQLRSYGWTEEIGDRPTLEWINPALIEVDESYQRETGLTKARKMASEFAWRGFGAVVVNKRKDGSYYCPDGGHRVLAGRLRPDVDDIPCVVFSEMTIPEEAASFVTINKNRRGMSGLQLYAAQKVAQNPDVLQVDRIITEYGYSVGSSQGPGVIKAAQTLLKIYTEGRLESVMYFIRACWPGNSVSVTSHFMRGLSWFIALYNDAEKPLPKEKMIKKFKAVDPVVIEKRARTIRELLTTANWSVSYQRAFVDIYNARLREDRRLQMRNIRGAIGVMSSKE